MKNKKNSVYLIVFFTLLLLVLFGASYAYFSVNTSSDNTLGRITSNIDCIDISYSEDNVIDLENAYPIEDEYALNNLTPVTVTVTNNCSTNLGDLNYTLALTTLRNNEGFIDDDQIRILTKRKKGSYGESTLLDVDYVSNLDEIEEGNVKTYLLTELNRNDITKDYANKTIYRIDSTVIENAKTNVYKVYLWMDYWEGDTTHTGIRNNSTMNKDFKSVISLVVNADNYEETEFCSKYGITDLNECLIRNDSKSDEATAKSTILARSQNVDFNQIAGGSTFKEVSTNYDYTSNSNQKSAIKSTANRVYFGTGYTFNTSNGKFNLTNATLYDFPNIYLSDNNNTYYTCLSTSTTNCSTIYTIENVNNIDNVYYLKKGTRITREIANSVITLDNGLYQAEDDYGTSYYYRGVIDNNWVEFGEENGSPILWRIIRINGDGSIRMIYAGTKDNHTGENQRILLSDNTRVTGFNYDRYDAAYLGYMYDLKQKYYEDTTRSQFTGIGSGTVYKFYKAPNFSETNNCTGEITNADGTITGTCTLKASDGYIESTLYDKFKTNDINNEYNYTCWGYGTTDANGNTTCQMVSMIDSSVNNTKINDIYDTRANVYYKGYLSYDYNTMTTNRLDSKIKTELDKWYQKVFKNTEYEGYLSDEIFCNDRSTTVPKDDGTTTTLNNQVGTSYDNANTYYGAYNRLSYTNSSWKKKILPSLKCNQKNDAFTVSDEVKGNGSLTYPIGLITLDEASFAGGRYGETYENYGYYLYIGQHYWTMSPISLITPYASARGARVTSSGSLYYYYPSNSLGVRPVINLTSEALYAGGNGTEDNPYRIEMN